jgi:hypothetical protein
MVMARNLYSEAEALAEMASQVGLGDLAASLTDAIEVGFTSTEILMHIRTVLLEALPSLDDTPKLHDHAVALIDGINEALVPPRQ